MIGLFSVVSQELVTFKNIESIVIIIVIIIIIININIIIIIIIIIIISRIVTIIIIIIIIKLYKQSILFHCSNTCSTI